MVLGNRAALVKSFSLLIVAILLASTVAATAFLIIPRFIHQNSSLTVVVTGINKLVPGAKGLYGWIRVKGTAPGIWGIAVTKTIPRGAQSVSVTLPTQRIIKLSKKALAELSKRGNIPAYTSTQIVAKEASAVTITLYLYDDKGHHYIATAVIGSYDVALKDLHDPEKAFHAVMKDPYYIYTHRSILIVPPSNFAVVNATPVYSTIVHRVYNMSTPKPPKNAKIEPTTYSLTCNDVVTPDNYIIYQSEYGYDFSYNDFIALSSLYYSNMPQSFASHLSGANPQQVYDTFRKVFGAAVYVPSSCVAPVEAAITHWYRYINPGLMKLSTFWSRLAGKNIEWKSITPVNRKELLHEMPLVALIGKCDNNCAEGNPTIIVTMAQAKHHYYKCGITALGEIILGKEHSLLLIGLGGASMTPINAARHQISYITADIERTWHGDGVYIDYYVEPAYIYNYYDGELHMFWRVVPIIAFTPLYDDVILQNTLHGATVGPWDSKYNELYTKYSDEISDVDITPVKIYDKVITSSSVANETIDLVGMHSANAGALAGLATGIAQQALKKLIVSVASQAAKKLLSVVSMVLSFAYTSRDASTTVVKLERTSDVPPGVQVHVVIYRYDQYLGYSNTAGVFNPIAPFIMTYEVEFNPSSGGGIPPHPPNLPTHRSP